MMSGSSPVHQMPGLNIPSLARLTLVEGAIYDMTMPSTQQPHFCAVHNCRSLPMIGPAPQVQLHLARVLLHLDRMI